MVVNRLSLNFNGLSLCQDLTIDGSDPGTALLNKADYSAYGVNQSITSVADRPQIIVAILCAT